jgi:biotin operon repressor
MANPQAEIVISAVDKTKVAFATLKKNLADIESRGKAVNAVFGRFLPALTTAGLVGFAKSVIDAADGMNDLSLRTGVSVERIAAWDLATRQSGTSVDALASALDKGSKYLVEHAEELKKIGINAATSEELIFQLSDVISSLPADDPRRAAIAMQVLGKSAGELLPLLSQGSDALREMVNQSSKNAQVMAELAPLADNFNDRLETMTFRANVAVAKGLGPLLTALEKLIALSDDIEKKAEGTQKALTFTGIGAAINPLFSIPGVYLAIAGSAEQVTEKTKESTGATTDYEKEARALRIQLGLLNGQLEEQQKNLEKSRRSLNADAYKQNVDALKNQIKGFQDLGSAMQSAFESAGDAAAEASRKAQDLLQSAASRRLTAQDRITDLDLQDAAPEDADAVRNMQILDALEKAGSARIQADFQRLQGNTAQAERSLDLAEQQAQRADDLTGRLTDEGLARDRILEAAEALATIDESRAAVQTKLAEEETARQEALRKQMQENETRIVDYTTRLTELAAKIKELSESEATIKIKLDEEALAKTNQQIDELKNRIANANFQNFTGVHDSAGNAVFRDPLPGLATGGPIVGPGTGTSDSILARLSRGEHVLTDQEVRAAGGHDAIYRLRRALLERRLPRFANGGEVSSALARVTSTTTSPSTSSVTGMDRGVIVISGGQRVEIQAKPSEFDKLERAALMHGGLKK